MWFNQRRTGNLGVIKEEEEMGMQEMDAVM
jgi:hypothetical protein